MFCNVYFNGALGSLKADYSGNTDDPVFDISGFYFHDAAVQTNGVDDPVKQRADQRIRLASNIRYFPSKVAGLRSPFLPERVQPPGVRQPEHRSDQLELREGDEPGQPAA